MTALATIEKRTPESLLPEIFAKAVIHTHFPSEDEHGNPMIGRFLLENGRLPAVTDDIKPWRYHGWLVPIIQLAESHPSVVPRYDYVLRTVEAGHLLDEPIPKITFLSEGGREAAAGAKQLEQLVRVIKERTGHSAGFRDLLEWMSFGLGLLHTPSPLKDEVQEQLYRTFDIGLWLSNPTDYLGHYMAENRHGIGSGFFPTPMCLCTMMAEMDFMDDVDHRTKRTLDCCVGTGRLLMAASNYSLRLFGQDIDSTCVMASQINLAVYAPWYLIPESFFPQRAPEPAPAETRTAGISQPALFDLS